MNFDFIYQFLADVGYAHPLHPTITHLTIGLVMGQQFTVTTDLNRSSAFWSAKNGF